MEKLRDARGRVVAELGSYVVRRKCVACGAIVASSDCCEHCGAHPLDSVPVVGRWHFPRLPLFGRAAPPRFVEKDNEHV